jgi:hypothetical protein
MKPQITKKPPQTDTPGRKALRQAYKQTAQVYGTGLPASNSAGTKCRKLPAITLSCLAPPTKIVV